MSPPSVSAVVPAYNSAAFLPQAIESVLRQSHPVDEIVVVDDGSTDDTARIVKRYPSLRYLRRENGGPAAARNAGIAAARSEFVAFLDADDLWVRHKIERQLKMQALHGGKALVFADQAEIDARGEILVHSVLRKRGVLDFLEALSGTPMPNALARILQKNFVPTGTVLVPRALLQEVSGFDPSIRYGEDLELWSRVAIRYPLVCVPEVLLLYRRHGANITRNQLPMLHDLARVMEKVRGSAAAEVRRQGLDPDALVASAWADLGYWHFAHDDYALARQAFSRSLREKPSLRAAKYAAASALPAAITFRLRRLKQKFAIHR